MRAAPCPGRRSDRRAILRAFVLITVAGLACPSAAGWSATQDCASIVSPKKPLTPSSSDTLRVSLELPEEVKPGTPVPMTLRVENRTERTVELHLTGRPVAFDLTITDEGGEVVWRRLEDQRIAMVLRLESLAPGDSLEFQDTWDQRTSAGDNVPPGSYAVRGEVLTEGEPLVTLSRTLRVLP